MSNTSFGPDISREFVRHALATLAYRSSKAIRNAPEYYPSFSIDPGLRTPLAILSHMSDLLDWSLRIAQGNESWTMAEPQTWEYEVERYYQALHTLDTFLDSEVPLKATAERMLQGPIADALAHTGQLVLLRRLAGSPVKSEDYSRAEVIAGNVSQEQRVPKFEF